MKKIQLLRTRFGDDIVAEFLPAARETRKVAIITSGAPGYPGGKGELMEFLARRGFFSILPRYRGTWESGGTFLEFPPSDDVKLIMDQVPHGFSDLWGGAKYSLPDPEFYIFGGSFGGPASILSSGDPRVAKAVAISAVVDWREQEKTLEPLDLMSEYVPSAFGAAYRADPSVWHRLSAGNFYNPIDEKEKVKGEKLLLVHAKDDLVVHPGPAAAFAKDIGARFVLLPHGGHMGAGSTHEPMVWKHVERFLRGK